MRKLSESLWSEIQDRSAGITQRKEDDVNLMSGKDFCDYLNDNYIGKDGHKIIYDEISNRISISILKYFTNCFYNIAYNYNSNIIIMNDEVESIYPELCKMIKENFKVVKKIVSNPTYTQFIIFPPDGSECTNRFFVDVVNFIIDNADENVLSFKKKHINESIWSDIQDRSMGKTVRKEDDINLLDVDEFIEYLKKSYKVLIHDRIIGFYIEDHKCKISIPIEMNDYNETPNVGNRILSIIIDLEPGGEILIMPNMYVFRLYPRKIQKTFGDKYIINTSTRTLTPKDKIINNSVIVDVIDKLLGMVENPILKKN